jgi:hypothetical protein
MLPALMSPGDKLPAAAVTRGETEAAGAVATQDGENSGDGDGAASPPPRRVAARKPAPKRRAPARRRRRSDSFSTSLSEDEESDEASEHDGSDSGEENDDSDSASDESTKDGAAVTETSGGVEFEQSVLLGSGTGQDEDSAISHSGVARAAAVGDESVVEVQPTRRGTEGSHTPAPTHVLIDDD